MPRNTELTSMGQRMIGNMVTGKPVLAINGAGAATVKTTNAINYAIDGIAYSKAALAAQALAVIPGAAAFSVQPVSTTVYYVLAVNNAGAIGVVQGTYVGQSLAVPGVGQGDGIVPDVPLGWVPFGLIKITTNSSTTFTPATTALDAAGLTVSFYDLQVLPTQLRP